MQIIKRQVFRENVPYARFIKVEFAMLLEHMKIAPVSTIKGFHGYIFENGIRKPIYDIIVRDGAKD